MSITSKQYGIKIKLDFCIVEVQFMQKANTFQALTGHMKELSVNTQFFSCKQ